MLHPPLRRHAPLRRHSLLRRHPHRRGQTRTVVTESHRPGGVNVSFWLAAGLVLPALYGLALALAVVVDQFRAG